MDNGDVINRPLENLSEDELLTLHFTAPREMDGSARLKQHDNVHQQIAAFEKLLQHAINRFSTDKLYQMMHLVIDVLPYIPRPRYAKHDDQPSDEISSLQHLREILVEFKNPQRRGLEKEEESHVVKYFDTFFEDISYLKSLKNYFDQKVYACLYDYFYDPEDDTLNPREALKREKKGRVTFQESRGSGNPSLPDNPSLPVSDEERAKLTSLNETQEEAELEFYFDRLSDSEKLSMAVKKMFQINLRWDGLFEDGTVDARLFDPDSRHEILQFTLYEQFEKILRLVPDIFVKAYKSVELAKLWWTQANKIYDVLPQRNSKKRSEKEIARRIEALEKKLTDIRNEIKRHEDLLGMLTDDLDNLKERETRYVSLSEQCEKLESRKNDMGDRYNAIFEQRNELKHALEGLDPNSLRYRETHLELKDWEGRFFDSQVELRMLTFQFQLIQNDFLVELEARPDLIRFQVDIESKIEDTKQAIWNKSAEERDSEKRLTLLKTNCERMRIIMRKILQSKDEERLNDSTKYRKKTTDQPNTNKSNVGADVELENNRRKEHRRSTLDKLNTGNIITDTKNKKNKHNNKGIDNGKKDSEEYDKETKRETKNNHKSIDGDVRYEDRSGWFEDDGGKHRNKRDIVKDKGKMSSSNQDIGTQKVHEEAIASDDGNDADTDTPTPRTKIPGYQRNNAYRYDYHV